MPASKWLLPALLLVLPAGTGAARDLYTARSLYRDILVYQDDNLRCMKFGRHDGGRQSCLDLADPDRLVFNYTKMMMAAFYLNPQPSRILIVGLGGGTLPTTFQKLLPDAAIDCVEIDPAVVAVAATYFGFVPGSNTRVIEEDGRVYVKRAGRDGTKYDLVILDAYDRDYIPEHMLTREFLSEVRQVLGPRGVLAANTFSSSGLYDHESATYYTVFGDFYRLRLNNRVILLRLGGLPGLDELRQNADLIEERLARFGTGRDWLLPLFAVERGWPAETSVLTDQYSPSNLLNGVRE